MRKSLIETQVLPIIAIELSNYLHCSVKDALSIMDIPTSIALRKPKISITKLEKYLAIENIEKIILHRELKDKYGEEALKFIQTLV
jgi:dihydrodipicolinate synthase/N-acetylneuraminate lyase